MLVSPMAPLAVCFLEQPIPIPYPPRLQSHIHSLLRQRGQQSGSGNISDMLRRIANLDPVPVLLFLASDAGA